MHIWRKSSCPLQVAFEEYKNVIMKGKMEKSGIADHITCWAPDN